MTEPQQASFQKLESRVNKHEETITQLLKIIASINRRIGEEKYMK